MNLTAGNEHERASVAFKDRVVDGKGDRPLEDVKGLIVLSVLVRRWPVPVRRTYGLIPTSAGSSSSERA